MLSVKPKTHDEFLDSLDDEKRTALEKLRQTIKAVAPGAEECISYGIPAFRLNNRVLVYYGAGKNHCAFYPGAHPIAEHKDELVAYSISKGTTRFSPKKPLPATLVRKLVKTRIAEYSRK
jgi:uncharacterized protein YdhG (YjbR/CyaY superfamily)